MKVSLFSMVTTAFAMIASVSSSGTNSHAYDSKEAFHLSEALGNQLPLLQQEECGNNCEMRSLEQKYQYLKQKRNMQTYQIDVLKGCRKQFSNQRQVERLEYTDYIFISATKEIIEKGDLRKIDPSRLKEVMLDSDGDFVNDYRVIFPEDKLLPSSTLQTFSTFVCKYPPRNNDDTDDFCNTKDRPIEALPQSAAIRVASINDSDRKKVVLRSLCDEVRVEWQIIINALIDYYVMKGFVEDLNQADTTTEPTIGTANAENDGISTSIRPSDEAYDADTQSSTALSNTADPIIKSTPNPIHTPSAIRSTHFPTTKLTPRPMTSRPVMTSSPASQSVTSSTGPVITTIEKKIEKEDETQQEQHNVEDETVKTDDWSTSKTHSVQLPSFSLILRLQSDSLTIDKVALVDETSRALSNHLKNTSSQGQRFKNVFLTMSIEDKDKNRRRRRILREDEHSQFTITAVFNGFAYYQGEAPSDDEVRDRVEEAFKDETLMESLKSSKDEVLAGVTEVIFVMKEPSIGDEAPSSSDPSGGSPDMNTSRINYISLITAVVGSIAGLLLVVSLILAWRQKRMNDWKEENVRPTLTMSRSETPPPSPSPSPPRNFVAQEEPLAPPPPRGPQSDLSNNVTQSDISTKGTQSQVFAPASSTGSSISGSYTLSAFDGEDASLTRMIDVKSVSCTSNRLVGDITLPMSSTAGDTTYASSDVSGGKTVESTVEVTQQPPHEILPPKGASNFSEDEMFDFVNNSVEHFKSKKMQEERAAKCVFDGVFDNVKIDL